MKRLLFITAFALAAAFATRAQVRVGVQAGPAFGGDKKNDTAFFANRHFTEKLKIGFHKGRLGLIVSGAFVQQNAGDPVADGRIPNFNPPGATFKYRFTGGKVNTTLISFGPQLCFPLGPVKLQVHVAGGVALTKNHTDTIARVINNISEGAYISRIDKSNTGAWSGGAGVEYFFNKRIGIGLHGDYLTYKIRYLNKDIRTGLQETEKEQKKQLLSVAGGITYKF